MPSPGTYLSALRQAEPRQLLWRPRRLIPPRMLAAGRAGGDAAARPVAAGLGVDPAPQSGPHPAPAEAGAFTAVGATRRFPSTGFWDDPSDGQLFLFHLHGFSDLASYAAGERTDEGDGFWSAVIASWLQECGTPQRPAWHPFPTSGRVIAWSAALSGGGWSRELSAPMEDSLRRQLRLLRRSIEWDVGGNHVIRNACALVIGGLCLDDGIARDRGLAALARELPRQLLADGGHLERSPSYHRAVLADLEDVSRALERSGMVPRLDLAPRLERMRAWLAGLSGPDGALPLLNDAWEGPAIAADDREFVDLADSGYVVLRHGSDQAVLDIGRLAPPHLPPHAHADALSFELWADGQRLVADPGSFTYTGPDRNAFRGTAAHATVEVDGKDQCRLWGDFRASGLPEVRRLRLDRSKAATVIAAEHDGYRSLPGPVLHRRTFCWLPGSGLVVADRLLGRERHRAVSRLPLGPGTSDEAGRIGPLGVTALGEGPAPRLLPGRYSPYLGTATETGVITRELDVTPGATFGWALLREGSSAELDGDRVVVRPASGPEFSFEAA